MSLFNPEIVYNKKPISKHPWEHRIKGKHYGTYQYSHNTVENPKYPIQKTDNTKRFQFIVIGNRVTREFIYCLHLVRGLYKYRKKQFQAPIVRGVSSVEWPKVWNDLKIQFGQAVYCINSQVVVLLDNEILGGEKELVELIETKYIYNYPKHLDYHKEGIEQFSNYVQACGRPCAYLHIAVDDKPIGALVFMLYSDITPHTCQNFITLCELTKGGYKGTPVHRIVQDGWIQCGGFALKSPYKLDCENYIVPQDRRGVLCMANDGRNKDCSTQFFVLLQPAIWMRHKYVGFGQLIEGEHTLKKIENIPTWYESPLSNITIYDAGVFNMECQWRPINKTATDYISGHIEDLVILGKLFYDALLENVYAALDDKTRQAEDLLNDVKEIKEEKKQTRTSKRAKSKPSGDTMEQKSSGGVTSSASTNNQYDVEEYEDYMMEEMSSGLQTTIILADLTPKSSKVLEKPYYLPLTDVPYPGEVESAFNLQRLLRGDYGLETDQIFDARKRAFSYVKRDLPPVPKELIDALFECYDIDENLSDTSIESCCEKELRAYVRQNVDSVSFGGLVIKKMSHVLEKYNKFEGTDDKTKFTDEELRLFRVTKKEIENHQKQRVSFNDKQLKQSHHKIRRRPTGFVFEHDVRELEEILEKYVRTEDKESTVIDELRKVRLDITDRERKGVTYNKKATEGENRTSTLMRLYREVTISSFDLMPTLKTFRLSEERNQDCNYTYLTNSQVLIKDESVNKFIKPLRGPVLGSALDLQHGKTLTRKVSSDYANTLNPTSYDPPTLRTIEYAKQRPSMSITDYKSKNQKYKDEQTTAKEKIKLRGLAATTKL